AATQGASEPTISPGREDGRPVVVDPPTAEAPIAASSQLKPHPVFTSVTSQLRSTTFPGKILLASEQANFFNALFLTGASVVASARFNTLPAVGPSVPSYEVSAGIAGGEQNLVLLSGQRGRQAYDDKAVRPSDEPTCASPARYCAYTFYIAGPPIVET